MEFLSKFWKPLAFAVLAVIVAFGVALAYGKANQYWQMLKDQIIAEQKEIQKGLEDQVQLLATQKKTAEEQMAKLKQERERIKRQYAFLQGEKDALAKKLAAITVPTDPDDIVRGFWAVGLKSAHTRPAAR